MDLDNALQYSYEEQCFMNIESLRQQVLQEEASNRTKGKNWKRYRLFRYNIFEEIEDSRREHLDKILLYTLKNMGKVISNNIQEESRKRASSVSTPTPCRDLTESPVSSRAQSESLESPTQHFHRSRSLSNVSDVLDPVIEVIAISSDEEISDDEDSKIKKEIPDFNVNERFRFSGRNSSRAESCSGDVDESQFRPFARENIDNNSQWPEGTLVTISRDTSSNFMYDNDGVIHLKPRKYIKFSLMGLCRQPLFLFLISKVIKLIEDDNYITKRELYYLCKEFCKVKIKRSGNSQTQSSSGTQTDATQATISQSAAQAIFSQPATQSQQGSQNSVTRYSSAKLDTALDDLCTLVGCSKSHLRILAQSKGLVYGNLKFKLKNGEMFDCLSSKEGTNLPTAKSPIIHVESNAKFILVIEKDSVFQKMLEHEDSIHFVSNYKAILFTAKGYPDLTSKAFLNFLWSKLKIPILALTDADPHGFEIVCSYKFGNYSTAYESVYLATPQIKWLGLLPGDVMRLDLPDSKTSPHTSIDTRKLNSLLTRPYLKTRFTWMKQLELMRSSNRKAQLEALDRNGEYLVRTYLPNKLKYSSWL